MQRNTFKSFFHNKSRNVQENVQKYRSFLVVSSSLQSDREPGGQPQQKKNPISCSPSRIRTSLSFPSPWSNTSGASFKYLFYSFFPIFSIDQKQGSFRFPQVLIRFVLKVFSFTSTPPFHTTVGRVPTIPGMAKEGRRGQNTASNNHCPRGYCRIVVLWG